MDLFEFINLIFRDKQTALAQSDYEKKKHFFMINRLCAIQYPNQAIYFSQITINPARVVDHWIHFLTKIYSRVPDFFWTKSEKSKELTKKKKTSLDFNQDEIYFLINTLEMSKLDVMSLIENEPEQLKKFLKDLNFQRKA